MKSFVFQAISKTEAEGSLARNDPVATIVATGNFFELQSGTLLVARDGTSRNIADSAARIGPGNRSPVSTSSSTGARRTGYSPSSSRSGCSQ